MCSLLILQNCIGLGRLQVSDGCKWVTVAGCKWVQHCELWRTEMVAVQRLWSFDVGPFWGGSLLPQRRDVSQSQWAVTVRALEQTTLPLLRLSSVKFVWMTFPDVIQNAPLKLKLFPAVRARVWRHILFLHLPFLLRWNFSNSNLEVRTNGFTAPHSASKTRQKLY